MFQNLNRIFMFAVLHSDINSPKSGLLHLISQLKRRGAKRGSGQGKLTYTFSAERQRLSAGFRRFPPV